METNRPAVTVVIPAHNAERWHSLVRAVASARSQTIPAAEVIVVVDHNPTLFHRIRRDLAGITVLESEYLPGAAGTRNTGAFHAQTSLIAFLDDDTVADPEWLAHLVAAFGDPRVIGAGAGVTPEWQTTRPRWLPDEFLWAAGGATATHGTRPAGMVVRRDPFRQVGGFGSGAGNSLYRRMSSLDGGRWTFVTEALVRHQVAAGTTTFGAFLRRCYTEGRGTIRMADLLPAANQRGALPRPLPTADARTLPRAHAVTDARDLHRALARNLAAALRASNVRALPRALAAAGARDLPRALPVSDVRGLPRALPVSDVRGLPRALARILAAALRGEGADHVLRAGGVLAGVAAAVLGTVVESVTARRIPLRVLEPAR